VLEARDKVFCDGALVSATDASEHFEVKVEELCVEQPSGQPRVRDLATSSPVDGGADELTVHALGLFEVASVLDLTRRQPGGTVTVKYDPDNPAQAMIYGW
jgi:hypothetical protein